MIKLMDILKEKFYDITKTKDDWVDLEQPSIKPIAVKDIPLKQNLYHLIDDTYRRVLGEPHIGIKSVNDILNSKYDYWEAINIDNDVDADAVIFGKTTKYGIKIAGIGHDGVPISKKKLLQFQIELLKTPGYYCEASSPVSDIFMSKGLLPNDATVIKKMFGDRNDLKIFDDNSYVRIHSSNNEEIKKYLFGNPKI